MPVAAMELERLALAFELARRLAWAAVPEAEPLEAPGALARFLLLRYGRVDQEVGGAVYLDAKQRLIALREMFTGGPSKATVSPMPLLRAALQLGSVSFAFFHTHTSSDPTPSLEDLSFTRRLKDAAEQLGLQLADHLIVAQGGRWCSLRQAGRL
ncbi:MAG TPA: JAB domain-containing protein [Thermoanaerobaculia bacterium]|nr:JAB domain-containing protein [Thermoanaerobaculia bacterium]